MTEISISKLANKKNIVNLLFFIVFIWILIAITSNIHSYNTYYTREARSVIYIFLSGVALFFIHNMVLLPIKLDEKNNRKYLWLSLACIIAFALIEVFLLLDIIIRMDNPDDYIFGINPNQLLNLDSLIRITAFICVPLLAIEILSVIYMLLVYGFRVISPYLETFVHVVVITMSFALIITMPELKSKDISIIFPLLLVFYTNTFLITPILLRYKKTMTYLLGLFTLVLSYFFLRTILLTFFGLPQFNPETGDPYTRDNIPEIIFNTPGIIVLIITLFLSFVYGYMRINIKAKEKSFNVKLGKKESELQLLKSQVNPHFLFNTLNTLYATALVESAEKTGASIAKLASLLRYMQKDINNDFIPLENEITYLQDYITIQKLRCAIEPQVETQFLNIENQLISPGLFIPFVENAFKYGIDPSKPSKLALSVICDDDNINFSCINSCDDEFKTFYKEQSLGIGINNAKQRLELVYPKSHSFEISKKDNEFSVRITIRSNKRLNTEH